MQLHGVIAEALLDPDFNFSATQAGHSLSPPGLDEAPAEMLMGHVCNKQISHQTMKRPVQFVSTMPMGQESNHLVMHELIILLYYLLYSDVNMLLPQYPFQNAL